jgi:hypothetical protein
MMCAPLRGLLDGHGHIQRMLQYHTFCCPGKFQLSRHLLLRGRIAWRVTVWRDTQQVSCLVKGSLCKLLSELMGESHFGEILGN